MAANTADALEKYSYLTEPDDSLKCLICLGVAEEPWQHGKCGRLFCKECIEKYGKNKPCPNCKREQPQYFEDNRGRRDINALDVKCSNADRKCEWQGTVGTLEEHVAKYEFTLVPCPKECQDNEKRVQHFIRKDLANHLAAECPNRDYECEHCGEKGTYATITQNHDETCEKKILPCPNANCTDAIQRQNVQKHLETCKFTEVACKYNTLGCAVKMKRKDISAHEAEDKLHLHMALDTISTMKEENIKVLRNGESFTFKVRNFDKEKKDNTTLYSPSFYTGTNGYCMNVRVILNGNKSGKGTHISIYATFLEGKNDKELIWPFVGDITFTLLNQLEDDNHFQKTTNITRDINIRPKGSTYRGRGFHDFIPHSVLAQTGNTQYLKDDTLYFRVSINIPHSKPWLE